MRITCLGAAQCVTGSSFLIDNGRRYLVDCGLFQGGRQMEALNRKGWGFSPREIEAVFLTHAHIDHCGRLPALVRDGFRGKIYATAPTVELCKILLLDSAHIQEMEAEWQTRKSKRRGEAHLEPLYTVQDAEACLPFFEPVERGAPFQVDAGMRVCFRTAGHILGSSVLEMWSGTDGAKAPKTVFSGDLGYPGQMIVEDPETIRDADVLFMESTYGNRNHKPRPESEEELVRAIDHSYRHGEKVLIPAFAVERTQEILILLGKFFREKRIPSMPVYVDSPLAIAATGIFRRMKDYYDSETRALLESGNDPFDFEQLVFSRTPKESMQIDQSAGPAIVIAGNGMCTAGRIKHHLKHHLWRPGCSVVIVGFQAAGSLGRSLVEGVKLVKVLGERVIVRAKIYTIGGLSAHADQTHLLEWLGHFDNPKLRVYVIHGEETVSREFADIIGRKFGFMACAPAMGDVITPSALECPTPAPALEEEARWRRHLAKVLQKTEEIRGALGAGKDLPSHVLQRLEDELASAEGHLDEALHNIGKR